MTGRVLPQNDGLEALSGPLGQGWGQIDIADPSSFVGLVNGSHCHIGAALGDSAANRRIRSRIARYRRRDDRDLPTSP